MTTWLDKLKLAETQLERVHPSSRDPVDWAELSHFGFHALENAVDAASLRVGLSIQKTHPSRVSAAERLHLDHGLADVSELLQDLNAVRKSEAYGDVVAPVLHPEDTAVEIDQYVRSVRELIERYQ